MQPEDTTPRDEALAVTPDQPPDPDEQPYHVLASYQPVDAEGRVLGDPALVSWLSTERDHVTVITSSAPDLRVTHQSQPLVRPHVGRPRLEERADFLAAIALVPGYQRDGLNPAKMVERLAIPQMTPRKLQDWMRHARKIGLLK